MLQRTLLIICYFPLEKLCRLSNYILASHISIDFVLQGSFKYLFWCMGSESTFYLLKIGIAHARLNKMQGDCICPTACTLPVGYPEAPPLGLEADYQMRCFKPVMQLLQSIWNRMMKATKPFLVPL